MIIGDLEIAKKDKMKQTNLVRFEARIIDWEEEDQGNDVSVYYPVVSYEYEGREHVETVRNYKMGGGGQWQTFGRKETLWVLIDPLGRNKIKACPEEVNELRGDTALRVILFVVIFLLIGVLVSDL